jgi:hypothetical protein
MYGKGVVEGEFLEDGVERMHSVGPRFKNPQAEV